MVFCFVTHIFHGRYEYPFHALRVWCFTEFDQLTVDFSFCKDDVDESDLGDASMTLLTTISDNAMSPVHYNPVKITVILEGDLVTTLPRLPDAFMIMFGLIYALHLSYLQGLMNTFGVTWFG